MARMMILCSSNIAVLLCRSYSLQVLLLCLHIFLSVVTQTNPTTDPKEVKAVNSLFSNWSIRASGWNISGNPCSGQAINDTLDLARKGKAGIKCDCSYDSKSTCHVTELWVDRRDIVGRIPEDLQHLTYLRILNLRENYLTGSLPTFLGNFPDMTHLDLAFNSLSGAIPKEIGNLSKLEILVFSHNNFSGVLPPELGELVNFKRLFFGSSGFHGELPSTFASLQNLEIIHLRDNPFTGKIPDFIGGWTKLRNLYLQGHSFQGPIPSNFENLTQLVYLHIGEVNGSSSLAFIKNMTKLQNLVIGNSMISGTLPNNFDRFENLSRLDLSFNNISGSIPKSLFNSKSLKYLLLGNNSLDGKLPRNKKNNAKLKYIDLSYNKMSGSIPPWVEEWDLSLNLVANNFAENDIKRFPSSLPQGLNCLQKGQTCKDRKSSNFQFAINCGGPEIQASDGTVYEKDDEELGAAVYFANGAQNWAVSNVGVFPNDAPPTINTDGNLNNTSDVELFRNLRFSTSSLRYYGLGLQNGNYTVTLQFVESTFTNERSWKSLGRRVFDIYIQGELKQKDFDIRKEAGGFSYTVVPKEYPALVRDNLLEIHLFWAGKGTNSIPSAGNYGPAIAAVRVTPNFDKGSALNKQSIAGIASAIVVVIFLFV